jgi:hypothetical protein
MKLQRIRRAAAAAAVAATLALAAPVHAAGWENPAAGPGWLQQALEWITHLWVGGDEAGGLKPVIEKCGAGIDPSGCPGAAPPPEPANANSTGGADPEG